MKVFGISKWVVVGAAALVLAAGAVSSRLVAHAQADQVQFVFVSVDGTRDTPAQMTTFLNQFDKDFIGMTGSETQLRSIGAEYGLVFQKENIIAPPTSDDAEAQAAQPGDDHDEAATEPALDSQNYFVQHTSPTFLIDRNGALRMVAFYRTAAEALASSIRQLLAAQ